MVARKLETQVLDLGIASPPATRLKIVRGTKLDAIPLPPISPATPLVNRKTKAIYWQLQFDFTQPIQPLWSNNRQARQKRQPKPKSNLPRRERPDPRRAKVLDTVDLLRIDADKRAKAKGTNGNYLGKSQSSSRIPIARNAQEVARGIRHRDLFMEMVCDDVRYYEMTRISRGEIIKALNKSQTLRGLQPWEEEQIYKDHLSDTIIKVGHILEGGRFNPKENGKPLGENLLGYFYVFLKMDAPRFVRAMDMKAIQSIVVDEEDSEDPDHRSALTGALAMELSELPEFMEGNQKAFAEFVHAYIFEWTFRNVTKTEEDILDASFFRTYYGTNMKVKEIKQATGHNACRINTGYKAVLEYVKAHVDLNALVELFGRQIMSGCDC